MAGVLTGPTWYHMGFRRRESELERGEAHEDHSCELSRIKDICPQLGEAQFIPSRINANEPTARHILMKLQNIKEKTLKVMREETKAHL